MDEETDEESTYQLVGADEAEVNEGRLSISSPLARALIGKSAGDAFELKHAERHAQLRNTCRQLRLSRVPGLSPGRGSMYASHQGPNQGVEEWPRALG